MNIKIKLSILFLLGTMCTGCVTSTVHEGNNSAPNKKSITADGRALIHAQLAKNYLQKKQYAVAKKELEKSLEISPNHSDSNYVMALLMLELKLNAEAEKFFQKAVDSDPYNSSAAHDFGMLLCQTGKEAQSIQYFDLAAGNPLFNRPELSYMRAGECIARQNNTSGVKYLKKALNIDPRLRPALFRLAKLQYDSKSYLSARAYFERYFAITKPQPGALLLGFQIESALKSNDAAENYKQSLLQHFPGSKAAGVLRKILGAN